MLYLKVEQKMWVIEFGQNKEFGRQVIANLYLIANAYISNNNLYTIDGPIITQLCSYMFWRILIFIHYTLFDAVIWVLLHVL